MLVAYIVRLSPDALAQGRVAGEVQVVDSGLRHVVRSGEELLALLLGDRPSE
jgi:hypothetical protein